MAQCMMPTTLGAPLEAGVQEWYAGPLGLCCSSNIVSHEAVEAPPHDEWFMEVEVPLAEEAVEVPVVKELTEVGVEVPVAEAAPAGGAPADGMVTALKAVVGALVISVLCGIAIALFSTTGFTVPTSVELESMEPKEKYDRPQYWVAVLSGTYIAIVVVGTVVIIDKYLTITFCDNDFGVL